METTDLMTAPESELIHEVVRLREENARLRDLLGAGSVWERWSARQREVHTTFCGGCARCVAGRRAAA